jgi:hypothetical protein
MSLAGIIALLLILVFVFILTSYLLRVITILVHVSFTLGTIIAGVRAIASQIETVPDTVASFRPPATPWRLAPGAGGPSEPKRLARYPANPPRR